MEQYKEAMKNLASLVKPNGYVPPSKRTLGYYFVKITKVLDLALKRSAMLEAIQFCGLRLLLEEVIEVPPHDIDNTDDYTYTL